METLEACRCDFGPQTVNPEGYMGPASLEQISTNVPVLTVRQLLNPVWSTGQSNMARHLSHRQFLRFAFLHSLVLFHIRALGFLVNFKKSSLTPSQQISFFDLRLDALVGPQRRRVLSLPRSVSAGTQMAFPNNVMVTGHNGINDCLVPLRLLKMVVDTLSQPVCIASPQGEAEGNRILHVPGGSPGSCTRVLD